MTTSHERYAILDQNKNRNFFSSFLETKLRADPVSLRLARQKESHPYRLSYLQKLATTNVKYSSQGSCHYGDYTGTQSLKWTRGISHRHSATPGTFLCVWTNMTSHAVKKKQLLHTYIHILYSNTIWFKAQSLWGRVKMITNG